MRLGQLARKISVRSSEITGFLASQHISIEDTSNTKLDTHQVRLIVGHFAPDKLSELLDLEPIQNTPELSQESVVNEEHTETSSPEILDETPPVLPEISIEQPTDESFDRSDVIKAPKVDLPGLKVLGKIELPEPKKKAEPNNEAEPLTSEPRRRVAGENKKPQPHRKERSSTHEGNPIAAQREREAQEAKRKREELAERAKDQRTKNYQKRVKVAPPTRRAQLIDEQTEELGSNETLAEPSGWWGKLKKWFRT